MKSTVLFTDLEQGSDAWLEFRKHKIGASDAPAIMGVSPYKTTEELWYEKKTGGTKPLENTYILKKGHEIEDIEMPKVEDKYGLIFKKPVVSHKYMQSMFASLDGYSDEGVIWECKYVSKDLYDKGEVPEKYYYQLIHQAWVVQSYIQKVPEIILSLVNSKGERLDIDVDKEYILEGLQYYPKAATDFYNSLAHETFKGKVKVVDEELNALFQHYKMVKTNLDIAKKTYESARKKLITHAETIADKIETDEFLITKHVVNSKPTFNLDKAKEDFPDLFHMRYYTEKPPRESTRITIK